MSNNMNSVSMVIIDTNTAIAILGIAAGIVVTIIAYLVRKLLGYEHRITQLETKIGDWGQYFKIIQSKVADEIAVPKKARRRRRKKNG